MERKWSAPCVLATGLPWRPPWRADAVRFSPVTSSSSSFFRLVRQPPSLLATVSDRRRVSSAIRTKLQTLNEAELLLKNICFARFFVDVVAVFAKIGGGSSDG